MARKQVFRNPNTNEFITPDANAPGGFRQLNADEMGALRPKKVLDEMGVSDFERFTMKNFARSPAQAHQFLVGRGYDVMKLGEGLNFAVRKGEEDEWRVVDPSAGGIGEFFRDMADLAADVGAGLAFAGGVAAGSGVASVATGAAVAGGFEAARQGVGSALGIPDNIGVGEIGLQAGLGGISGPIASGVGKVASAASRAITSRLPGVVATAGKGVEIIAGKISGIQEVKGLTIGDALVMRAQRMIGNNFEKLNRPEEVVAATRVYLDKIGGNGGVLSGLRAARDGLVKRGSKTIDLSNTADDIANVAFIRGAQEEARVFSTAELRSRAQSAEGAAARMLKEQIDAVVEGPPVKEGFKTVVGGGGILDASGNPIGGAAREVFDEAGFKAATEAWETKMRNQPIEVGIRIKELIQNWVSDNKGFVGVAEAGQRRAISTEFLGDMRALSVRLRERINGVMGEELRDAEGRTFGQINNRLFEMIDSRNDLRRFVGKGVGGAEEFIAKLAAPGKSDARDIITEFDRLFGLKLTDRIFDSTLGLAFTRSTAREFGVPSVLPRLGATGQFIGPSILAGATGGLGSDEGFSLSKGAAGFGVGLAIASPRTLVRVAPHVSRLGAALARRANALADLTLPSTVGTATRAAGMATVASIAKTEMGKAISRQDPTAAPVKKDVLRFVGGQ